MKTLRLPAQARRKKGRKSEEKGGEEQECPRAAMMPPENAARKKPRMREPKQRHPEAEVDATSSQTEEKT